MAAYTKCSATNVSVENKVCLVSSVEARRSFFIPNAIFVSTVTACEEHEETKLLVKDRSKHNSRIFICPFFVVITQRVLPIVYSVKWHRRIIG